MKQVRYLNVITYIIELGILLSVVGLLCGWYFQSYAWIVIGFIADCVAIISTVYICTWMLRASCKREKSTRHEW